MIIVSGVTISGSTRYFVLKCTKGEKWGYTFVLVAGKQLGLLLLASYPLETVARCPKGQVKTCPLEGFAECGNRKASRLRAQGVYSCK